MYTSFPDNVQVFSNQAESWGLNDHVPSAKKESVKFPLNNNSIPLFPFVGTPNETATLSTLPLLTSLTAPHLLHIPMPGATRGGRAGKRRGTASRKPPNTTTTTSTSEPLSDLISSALTATHSFLHHNDLLLLPSQTLTLTHLLTKSSLLLQSPPPPPPSPSPNCWFHRLLSSPSSDPLWPDFFRMSKPAFSLLLSSLSPSLLSSLPPSIPPHSALSSAVFRLAHSAPYSSLSLLFSLPCPSSACLAFFTVVKILSLHLGSHLFELRSDPNRIALGFSFLSLPNCFGVLASSRFPVSGDLKFLSVQALVDSEGRFLDVSAGWPSTMTPDSILAQSKLFNGVVESKEVLNGPDLRLSDGSLVPQYLIADSCYPLLTWLMTPYGGSDLMRLDRIVFNEVHRRAMGISRKAFKRVRRLWRLVDREWKEECVEFLPFVVVSCCLLYNFLIKHGEKLPDVDEEDDEGIEVSYGDDESIENEDARRVRDAIALHLTRVNQRR